MRALRIALLAGLVLAAFPFSLVRAADHTVIAFKDGQQIPIEAIPSFHCHDREFPVIHCFDQEGDRDRSVAAASRSSTLAVASIAYVTVYENSSYNGASMLIAQDYDALATIGWNDRVSSFRARNSETGRFYTDWFHLGNPYNFCCNQIVGVLGSWNETFSSVYRT